MPKNTAAAMSAPRNAMATKKTTSAAATSGVSPFIWSAKASWTRSSAMPKIAAAPMARPARMVRHPSGT